MKTIETAETIAMHFADRLEDLAQDEFRSVPVSNIERRPGRKVLAAACRELFRRIGLKGCSVTAPNYSMAQSVDVRWPRLHCEHSPCDDIESCPERQRNNKTAEHLRALLDHAFPACVNRSDSHSDYFDYCWSLS